jgi:Putative metal-binding motif/FG-GAP repeat
MRLARNASLVVMIAVILVGARAVRAEIPADDLPDILLGTPDYSAAAYQFAIGDFGGQPGQEIAAAVIVDVKTLEGTIEILHGNPAGWGQNHTLEAADVAVLVGDGLAIGQSMAVGQLDAEPLDDLLVGDPRRSANTGRILLLTGRANLQEWSSELTVNATPQFVGDDPGDFLGAAVAAGVDVTGDGQEDVLACAPGVDTNDGFGLGAFYVWEGVPPDDWNGSTKTPAEAWVTLTGESVWLSAASLCWSISVTHDLDGDGWPEIMLGDPFYNWGQGKVYVVSGDFASAEIAASVVAVTQLSIVGSGATAGFGLSLETVEGLAVDGYDRLLAVGNPNANDDRGAVTLFAPDAFPTADGLTLDEAHRIFQGPIAGTNAGFSLQATRGMGGHPGQLWIGANGLTAIENYGGAVALASQAALDLTPADAALDDLPGIVLGTAEEGYLGTALGSGDVDGDGLMDVLTSDYGGGHGRIYVMRGQLTSDQDEDGWIGGLEDCADDWYDVHPGADEICDGHPDNNCDEVEDPGDLDSDQDGVTPCAGDCDDAEPSVHDGAAEICDDGLDNDCDGDVDDQDIDCAGDDDDSGDDDDTGDDDDAGDDDEGLEDDDNPTGFRCECHSGGGVGGGAGAAAVLATWMVLLAVRFGRRRG